MIILGIETSCDETAAAVLQKDEGGIHILSNVVASSAKLQAKYGGVIPEQAAREQIKSIIPVIEEALRLASLAQGKQSLDAIAVTYGPGLIGSLLVGVETAKTLSLVWNKPLIPVNHLIGHFYANWITPSIVIPTPDLIRGKNLPPQSTVRPGKIATPYTVRYTARNDSFKMPQFPCIGLLVSGGHTDLVLFKDHHKYEYLGGTRDDAAGECFDKCARLLGLPYPGGPSIARLAERTKQAKLASTGNPSKFNLPRPMIDSKDFDFSFSGLKTAVANLIKEAPAVILRRKAEESSKHMRPPIVEDPLLIVQDDNKINGNKTLADLAASIQAAIVEVLVVKTIRAAQTFQVDQIIIAGGVAANKKLISEFINTINDKRLTINLHVPPPELCTDNGAMVAAAAFFQKPVKNPLTIQADPNLALSQ